MVQNQRKCHESQSITSKKSKHKLFSLFLLFVLSFFFLSAPHLLTPLLDSLGGEIEDHVGDADVNVPLCSSVSNGTICCDRTSFRSDICFMKGDIRTQPSSNSLFLHLPTRPHPHALPTRHRETIRPYTRKWETTVMTTITQLHLISNPPDPTTDNNPKCDVTHHSPAIFFSTGGYTGNVYHEFNDGIIPLFITSQHLNKNVVLVVLDFHDWWASKYADVISRLSRFRPIDFTADNRTHCFPEAIVGMRIHGELTIDPSANMINFKKLLKAAYLPDHKKTKKIKLKKKPKLVLMSRNGSRAILNEDSLVKICEQVGFQVRVLMPNPRTELSKVYRVLDSSDVMVGVHGAAMTHFLFMRPGAVVVQIIPLGTAWPAATYYEEPAVKMGLKYVGYKVGPRESSLFDEYEEGDVVLSDPESVARRGWEVTKRVYLDGQNVRVDLGRFRRRMVRVYWYSRSRMNESV